MTLFLSKFIYNKMKKLPAGEFMTKIFARKRQKLKF